MTKMKKSLTILLILFFMSSCRVYNNVSDLTNKIESVKTSLEEMNESVKNASQQIYKTQIKLGMTTAEFISIIGERAEKVDIKDTYYVYRVNQYDVNEYKTNSMFYYFRSSDDILFEINSDSSFDAVISKLNI